ncbi:hypothetical protein [Bacillus wiedmannii]|nr:hypothetical protein [Bacillus wiedmannii]MCQ6543961.1 hypothetical protein [Bacillus wiedmannii]MCU5576356.1 hypothetical protein [Bacillus wiedmannii]MDM5269173.1 hypothetical protein [Bacillus wiedmannii]WMS84871.1 hypothetical protein RE438_21110 [Bacillus wiedmannii]HDR7351627.1 hypothetical protein [Bacillus wiedmannii]
MLSFLFIMIIGIISGYIASLLFKNYPIRIAEQIRRTTGKATDLVA